MNSNTNNTNTVAVTDKIKGKTTTVFGWFLIVFFGLGTIGGFYSNDPAVWVATAFCMMLVLLGAFLVYLGAKIKRRLKRYRQYTVILASGKHVRIDDIAGMMNLPVDFIIADFKKMIARNLLRDIALDLKTNSVVRPQAAAPLQPFQPANLICNNCGAANQRSDTSVGVCEYCGSLLR